MSDLRSKPAPLAYSYEDAAAATGHSVSTLKRLIAQGQLTPRYANRKPVLLASELLAWLESLDSMPPEKSP